jgi:hypothetical protein
VIAFLQRSPVPVLSTVLGGVSTIAAPSTSAKVFAQWHAGTANWPEPGTTRTDSVSLCEHLHGCPPERRIGVEDESIAKGDRRVVLCNEVGLLDLPANWLGLRGGEPTSEMTDHPLETQTLAS